MILSGICFKRLSLLLSRFSRVPLFATLWIVVHQTSLSMGFSRQKYWRGLPCPPPGDLRNPGIKLLSLISSVLASGFFITRPSGKPFKRLWQYYYCSQGKHNVFFSFINILCFSHWGGLWQKIYKRKYVSILILEGLKLQKLVEPQNSKIHFLWPFLEGWLF